MTEEAPKEGALLSFYGNAFRNSTDKKQGSAQGIKSAQVGINSNGHEKHYLVTQEDQISEFVP